MLAKKEFTYMMMVTIKDSGSKTKKMEKGNIFGQLVNLKIVYMKVTGKMIKLMVKVYF